MDPRVALTEALAGDRTSARNYNTWTRNGGFCVVVNIDPGTNLWMMGVRSARVEKVGTKWVHIRHSMSGRAFRIAPELVTVSE